MSYDNWATIWSDHEELEKVLSSTKSQIGKWHDELRQGNIKLKIPMLEYTTGQKAPIVPIDFERETELIDSLEPLDTTKLIAKVGKPFKPFVAMLEGRFSAMIHLPDMIKCEWNFLIDNGLVSEQSKQEIEELLKLPDFLLIEKIEKSWVQTSPTEQKIQLKEKYKEEARQKFSGIDHVITEHLKKKKPTIIGTYNGQEHLVYMVGESPMNPPLIYFPKASAESLPNSFDFYGRIVGVVNFVPNPPLPTMPTLTVRSIICALPLM